ncbi:MAG: hypothetical protein P8Z50_01230, partial [candidate division WOR-3 bacterium]
MKYNTWKVLLVFSALLMFAFTGELAAQYNLIISPDGATLDLEDTQVFQARLTSSGTGVNGETIDFEVLDPPALGSVSPADSMTVNGGYAHTTYTASTVSGTDTLVASWEGLADTVIITINPGTATSLNVSPGDTTVVVAEDAVIVVELWDDYLNHVDATSGTQVSFSTSGDGTFGTASVNATTGCIEVAYTTDDTVTTDVITTELVSNGTRDYDTVHTIGGAPATVTLAASDDSIIVVSDGSLEIGIYAQIFDVYGNPSAYANYYPVGDPTMYEVIFSVSEGGGSFEYDTLEVNAAGQCENDYNSSTVAGVYTITATSGDAVSTMDITQLTDEPDSVVVTPDSIAIPAATDTALRAVLYDQYGNHVYADDERFASDIEWYLDYGNGYLHTESAYVGEDHNSYCVYTAYEFAADTANIGCWVDVPAEPWDEVIIFSAEPGDLHHFAVGIFEHMDTADVSDGSSIENVNVLTIEAQDINNIRIWTYENTDTVTLSLNESMAGASQITWFVMDYSSYPGFVVDTVVGLTASIPEGYIFEG